MCVCKVGRIIIPTLPIEKSRDWKVIECSKITQLVQERGKIQELNPSFI